MKPIFVQWGGGNIGKSFIGQVFSRGGYRVVFIDIDTKLIDAINAKGSYTVEVVGRDSIERMQIQDVSALHVSQEADVQQVIGEAALMGVSVGKNVWPHVARQLAHAIRKRYEMAPNRPLDIILAENIHGAAAFTSHLLKEHLPESFPLAQYVGLIETSIGKMVPVQTGSNPLLVRAEPYNELIVDRKGFLSAVPAIHDIHPVHPIGAYVDRKLFIHNLGHAAAAYLGHAAHPEKHYIADVLEDPAVFNQVKKTMHQSMEVLLHIYPTVFTRADLERHIDDLLFRFGNRSLKDTIFRVGRDLGRKLHYDDRLMGIIIEAQRIGMAWDRIGRVYQSALTFRATDEHGNRWQPDTEFLASLAGLSKQEQICRASGWKESPLPEAMCHTIAQAFELIV